MEEKKLVDDRRTIQIYGYFNIPGGSVPYICSQWIRVLSDRFNVKVKDYSREQDCRFPEIKKFLGEHDPVAEIGIYFGYPAYQKTTGCLVARNRFKVGVFTTETGLDELNVDFVRQVHWHKICVPSLYCKEIFNRCSNPNVEIINHGIHEDILNLDPASVNRTKDFTFLYIFNNSPTGGSLKRKNLHNLLEGFKFYQTKGFKGRLIVKTGSNIEENLEKLRNSYKGVAFDIKLMDPYELAHLYASCHVYVNPSRAEGFGLTVLEAAASGLPVVSPIHSGLTEFLNPSNCVVIDSVHDRSPASNFRYATNDGFLWRVQATDIGNAMIKAHKNYEDLKEKAMVNMRYIRERFSWKSVLGSFIKWCDEPI
jgi:glycosyltransferase involved in cell wall biosynthesis